MNYNKVIVCDIKNKKNTSIVNPADYKKTLKKYKYPCELVGGEEQQVKPYFDLDLVDDDDTFDWEADILEKQLTIQTLFEDTIDITDIYVVRRQYEKDGKIKYSSHYTVDKIRMSNYNIKLMLENNKCTDFDTSVYDKNRGVYSIYTNKKCNLDTELPPFLPEGDADISKYLISYIEEDFVDWDKNFDPPQKKDERRSKNVLDEINEACDKLKVKGNKIVKVDDDDDDSEDISAYDILTAKKYIRKVCDDLDIKKQLDNYDTWIKVMFAIMNICKTKKITNRDCREILHDLSAKSNKYDEDRVDEWINANIDKTETRDKKLGFNYLINTCIKTDNRQIWEKYYEKPSYSKIKNKFERHCFKCLNNIIYIDLNENRDEIDEEVFFILKQKELCEKYGHMTYHEKTVDKKGVWKVEEKQFIGKWIKDNHIKSYQSVCFCPKELEDKYIDKHFNLFKGFRASLLPPKYNYKIIQPFLNHIKEVLMNDNADYYNWFIQYLANIIQNPNVRSNVIIIFQGTQGAGKSIVVDTIANHIIGKEYAVSTSSPERVFFGTFNSLLCNKIFSVINEAGNELRGCMDKIKDLCVVDNINVEKKGKDPITFTNYNNFIGTTNNLNPFDIDWDDRRFAWFRTSDKYLGNEDYFNMLRDSIEHEDFASSLYNYLKYEINITIRNFQKSRPITQEYVKVKLRNLPNPIKFLQSHGIDFRKGRDNALLLRCISKSTFYGYYKKYCEDNKYTAYNECSFRAYLDKPNTGITVVKSHGTLSYRFEKDGFEKYMSQFKNKEYDDMPDVSEEYGEFSDDEE